MNQHLEKHLSNAHVGEQEIAFNHTIHTQASHLEVALFNSEQNADKTTAVISSFVTSSSLRGEKPLVHWLSDEFRKYPQLWKNEEILKTARQSSSLRTTSTNPVSHCNSIRIKAAARNHGLPERSREMLR